MPRSRQTAPDKVSATWRSWLSRLLCHGGPLLPSACMMGLGILFVSHLFFFLYTTWTSWPSSRQKKLGKALILRLPRDIKYKSRVRGRLGCDLASAAASASPPPPRRCHLLLPRHAACTSPPHCRAAPPRIPWPSPLSATQLISAGAPPPGGALRQNPRGPGRPRPPPASPPPTAGNNRGELRSSPFFCYFSFR